jgi:hypothetical protein
MGGGGNPDLMKNMRKAAMGAMGNFMGNNSGVGGFGGSHPPPPSYGPKVNTRPQPPQPTGGTGMGGFRGPNTNTNDLLNGLMEQDPRDIDDRIVNEIEDILNNASEDDDGPTTHTENGITLEI